MYVLSCVHVVSVSSILVSEITDLVASGFGICLSQPGGAASSHRYLLQSVDAGPFFLLLALETPKVLLQTVPTSGFRQGVGSAALGFPDEGMERLVCCCSSDV